MSEWLQRLRCRVFGHEVRRIGGGYLLTVYICKRCDEMLVGHKHFPAKYLIPTSRDELATMPSVVLDEVLS